VSEQDPHAPTHAGPTPEPTPVVGAADATTEQPAGSAAPDGAVSAFGPAELDPNPERRVGAAFVGGLAAALVLRSLANRRHR
jgi:hypothetical protein